MSDRVKIICPKCVKPFSERAGKLSVKTSGSGSEVFAFEDMERPANDGRRPSTIAVVRSAAHSGPMFDIAACPRCPASDRGSEEDLQLRRPLLILDPRLFAALTLEHADCPAGGRIEHAHNLRRLLSAGGTCLHRVWIKARKDFVLKIAVHL
jgi:hypothetical protein